MEKANRRPRWAAAAAVLISVIAATLWCDHAQAQAQLRETVKPVQIVQIYGRDTLSVGELETYRVRVKAPYATAYNWRLSDGTEIAGNPIVHRFDEPGRYELIATARNPKGTDSDTLYVVVLGERPPLSRLASNREPVSKDPVVTKPSPEVKPTAVAETTAKPSRGKSEAPKPQASTLKTGADGSYTWVIATYFQRSHADALANAYRAVGFRSSVFIDTGGKGSTVFRVTLGRFDSEQRALEAKAEVKSHGIKNPLLHRLPGA